VEAVDVLGRINCIYNRLRVDVSRQWQLNEDAVYVLIGIEGCDKPKKGRLRYIVGPPPMVDAAIRMLIVQARLRRPVRDRAGFGAGGSGLGRPSRLYSPKA
jgi:hypothetical protein